MTLTDMRRILSCLLGLTLLTLLGACGSGGSSGTRVDSGYDFPAAGVQPGVNVRDAGLGRIRGTVRNVSAQTVSGVTVTLYRLVTGRAADAGRPAAVGSCTTTSGAGGEYVFGNVPAGAYRLVMQSQSRDLTVAANADGTANFSGATGGTPTSAGRKWTVMIFMDGDNNLEPFAIQDVNELEQLPDSDEVTFLVLLDRISRFDASNGNWTDARRFVIRHDEDTQTMSSAKSTAEGGQATVMGELNMGSPATMRDFINWGQANYPAEHYLVGMWNHGSGWRPVNRQAPSNTDRGINWDDSSGTFLATDQTDDALNTNQPIDVLAIDACMMQMIEIAYQVRAKCDYVVASEASPSTLGYPYNLIFANLVAHPDIAPTQLCLDIINSYVPAAASYSAPTQSALRCDQLEPLMTAISNYGSTLASRDALFHDAIGLARGATQGYGEGDALYDGMRDLVDFIDKVNARTADSALLNAGNAVKTALAAALVGESHIGPSVANSHGLAIFLPNHGDWVSLRTDYRLTDFASASQWDEWLDQYHALR